MENYIEKLKKINGSGQCAFVLAIAEKIMKRLHKEYGVVLRG